VLNSNIKYPDLTNVQIDYLLAQVENGLPLQGLPNEGAVEFSDSYKHMSVVVVLNSVELLVDLMRFPGQLIPFSAKSIFASHISVAGESDSAENDSCDSPLEPNSPLCGLSDKVEADVYA
jgi:hypothetical protein